MGSDIGGSEKERDIGGPERESDTGGTEMERDIAGRSRDGRVTLGVQDMEVHWGQEME